MPALCLLETPIMSIELIIGLRNPGSNYHSTRHNAGEWFTQALVSHSDGQFKSDKKLQGALAQCQWQGHNFKVFMPDTFMNHSGRAVRAVAQFFKIPVENMLIVHDELDLDPGRVKLKTGGGHGGHNGLRDIFTQMGAKNFHRLRIGIGHPGHKDLVTSFVLGKPNIQDKQMIQDAIDRALVSIPTLLDKGMAAAMNQLNS